MSLGLALSSRYNGSNAEAACSGAGQLEAPVVHDVHAVVDVLHQLHQQHSLVRSTATQHSLVRTAGQSGHCRDTIIGLWRSTKGQYSSSLGF